MVNKELVKSVWKETQFYILCGNLVLLELVARDFGSWILARANTV
jgi:hypothetical protein